MIYEGFLDAMRALVPKEVTRVAVAAESVLSASGATTRKRENTLQGRVLSPVRVMVNISAMRL